MGYCHSNEVISNYQMTRNERVWELYTMSALYSGETKVHFFFPLICDKHNFAMSMKRRRSRSTVEVNLEEDVVEVGTVVGCSRRLHHPHKDLRGQVSGLNEVCETFYAHIIHQLLFVHNRNKHVVNKS